MDTPFVCSCQMKTDLEKSVDIFSFFDENFPLPGILTNLNNLSSEEMRCACCLMDTALLTMAQKKKILGWMKVK